MADDLLQVLTRFHREVVMPEVKNMIDDAIGTAVGGLRNEMVSHFDAIYQKFDRLETEYYAINAGLDRIEKRIGALEVRMAAIENNGRNELAELKAQVLDLRDRLAVVEANLQQQRAANAQLATGAPESQEHA